MKYLAILSVVLFCGCASLPDGQKGPWYAIHNQDEFTDEKTCIATVGRVTKVQGKWRQKSGYYYPFVAKTEGGLRVGIKSGDTVAMPVGDVQIRIDDNDAWKINTAETPLKFVPANPAIEAIKDNPQAMAMYQQSMEAVTRSTSPFTAATGDKAKAILTQMLEGTQLKYRTIGLNAAASSTGKFPLDSSLAEALSRCSIQ